MHTLLTGTYNAGEHSLVYDGDGLTSGLYFIRLQAGSVVLTQKAMLLK
jgi:hypothetical protein